MRDDQLDRPTGPGDAGDPIDPATPPDGVNDADRPAAAEDLKATADAIRTDLRRLDAVETTKASLDADDTRLNGLADEAVELSDRIGREARVERQLSTELG
jgi:predicted membrane chloride channel (bestrophin family)